ncbi:MAG TPA: three-Cys-motif partner protein TcmP [Spirochaetia bacterium]|nr:three-Cys-motif partner protein TcmP [Spirochaetia bacterium]
MAPDDVIGKWSEEKLQLLGKYLNAFVTVLKKQPWCQGYEYIDGFAGTGRPRTRDEMRYVDGSPRVALDIANPFTAYHFIERTDWRVQRLEQLREEFPERTISVYQGDCNKILGEKILPGLTETSYKRAIAFLDPFGMQLNWPTLEAVAQTNTVEIILNFPVMAINRNVRRRDQDTVSPAVQKRMNDFWGDNWQADIYQEEETLFGRETRLISQSAKELGQRYRARLLEIFRFCAVPVLMTNSKNAPLYCLIFAGQNEVGAKIANDIFMRYLTRMG